MVDLQRKWTQIELIHESERVLKESNIKDSLRNVEWMLCELLNNSRAQLYAYPEKEVPARVLSSLNQMLRRRANYEPLQYILGYTEFYGLRIDVAPGVLIPRPETELLVEESLSYLAPLTSPSILDIGTGSGCIALALKHKKPGARVHACDISLDALQIARANAQRLELDIDFFRCDIREGLERDLLFDLIISNPPYILEEEKTTIDPEVKDFEPEIALFVASDPLEFYRAVTQVALEHVRPNGYLCFETHTSYADDVARHIKNEGFSDVRLINDLAKKPRIVTGKKR